MENEQNTNKKMKTKYFIMLFLVLFQLGMFIWLAIEMSFYTQYIHITNWSHLISTIYLFLSILCDTSFICFQSKKFEKLQYFVHNSFSKVAFPYCFMISIGFWMIFLFGLIFGVATFAKKGIEISIFRIIINIHLHLGITIIMLIELFFYPREEMTITIQSGIVNIVIFIVYATTACIAKYVFDKNAYFFMGEINIFGLICVGVAIFVLLIGCVFLYNLISNKINRKYIDEKKSYIIHDLLTEDGDDNDDDSSNNNNDGGDLNINGNAVNNN